MFALKIASVAFAVAAAGVGVNAAWLWFNASSVPLPLPPAESEDAQLPFHTEWIVQIIEAGEKAAEKNQKASLWTAWSAILSAASVLTGAFA
jgi:hypothetical protein